MDDGQFDALTRWWSRPERRRLVFAALLAPFATLLGNDPAEANIAGSGSLGNPKRRRQSLRQQRRREKRRDRRHERRQDQRDARRDKGRDRPPQQSPGNAACAQFCTALYPPGPQRGQCISAAAHGTGPCYACGPKAPAAHPERCAAGCCPAERPYCIQDDCYECAVDGDCGTGRYCHAGACCTPPTYEEVCDPPGICSCAAAVVSCGPPIECGAIYCARLDPTFDCSEPTDEFRLLCGSGLGLGGPCTN